MIGFCDSHAADIEGIDDNVGGDGDGAEDAAGGGAAAGSGG